MSLFRSAVTDHHGEVDVGYLALFWGMIGWSLGLTFSIGGGVYALAQAVADHGEIIKDVGTSIGYVSGGFATMLGAVGLYRLGDRAPAPAVTTTTTVAPASKTTTTTQPDDNRP